MCCSTRPILGTKLELKLGSGFTRKYTISSQRRTKRKPLGIGAGLESGAEIDPEFFSETAHEHDKTVGSVAIVEAEQWMATSSTNGSASYKLRDIFRMKGILTIAGEDQRFVFQGVHMLFDGRADRPWKSRA